MDLAILTAQVTAALESRSSGVTADGLADFIEEIESYLSDRLRSDVLAYLHSRKPRLRSSHDDSRFQLDGVIYTLDIGESRVAPVSTLQVTVRKALDDKEWPRSSVRLGIGRDGSFDQVSVTVPDNLAAEVVPLAQIGQCVYEAGYLWLREFVQGVFDGMADAQAIELYGYLRRIFAAAQQPLLAEQVYLGSVSPNGVTYLADAATSKRIMATISRQETVSASSTGLATELLTTAIDFQKAFNREAIAHGNALNVDLTKAKYFEEQPLYDIAERALLGTSAVCFMPIASVGNQWLSSWFPAAIREDVIRVLGNPIHRRRFQQIFADHQSQLRQWKTSLRKAGPALIRKFVVKLAAEFVREIFTEH